MKLAQSVEWLCTVLQQCSRSKHENVKTMFSDKLDKSWEAITVLLGETFSIVS